ncbi:DUF192 domain-containing protein [Maricaulis sp.]|uniref:DUF192 domain-containing protein n=1 Tax=Maricaulis sp. TaxID=1486257 RepID=UPI001B24664E|nr:DUF192 domain-containing protein [Maricaulis sp.]MBO6797913.1 DUF192 domain-containing protein [Maricaulis sp.]
MRILISSLLVSAFAGAAAAQVDPSAQDTVIEFGGPESVIIATAENEHEFVVELAETPEQMQRGLMWRETLDPGAGMLFRYDPVRPASMWMENTLIALDIVYVDEDGVIEKIIAYAQPQSRRSLSADTDVAGVLELAAGRTVDLEIRPGDIVRHRFFDNTETIAEEAVDEAAETETAEETVSDTQ